MTVFLTIAAFFLPLFVQARNTSVNVRVSITIPERPRDNAKETVLGSRINISGIREEEMVTKENRRTVENKEVTMRTVVLR